jgi:hypothetical protein
MNDDTSSITVRISPLTNAELARMSDAELCEDMMTTARYWDALTAREAQLSAETARRLNRL